MSRPMHFKCPNCKQYVRAPVQDTHIEDDAVVRRRICEKCGIRLKTSERILEYYEKNKKIRTVKRCIPNDYDLAVNGAWFKGMD